MGDASPTSREGPRQLYRPRRDLLVHFTAAGGAGGVVRFRVDIPDPRLRVQLAVRAVPDDQIRRPNDVLAGRALKLWLSTLEDDEADGGSAGGLGTPITNLEGTSGVPIAFPADAGLGGYGREFSTLGNAIQGVITIPAQPALAAQACKLFLQTRFAPQVQQVIPWDQWEEIRAQCKHQALTDPFNT
jgi:hypothetical protein